MYFSQHLWVQNQLPEKTVGAAAPTAPTLTGPLIMQYVFYEKWWKSYLVVLISVQIFQTSCLLVEKCDFLWFIKN